ncbi:Arc family DNA-binding protein [Shinella sp.]|uniref:Arc family DNA-binding protein n=1 Tax=Shinella sp. TaxID=1870904 RepID=UPI003F70680D
MRKVTTSLRIPLDVKAFVDQEAERNGSSQNSEIIRAVRERMDRVKRGEMPAPAGH